MELTEYALRLHPVVQPPPLVFPSPPGGFRFESAAISLAGGLYLADRAGEPEPTIVARRWLEKSGRGLGGRRGRVGQEAECGQGVGDKRFLRGQGTSRNRDRLLGGHGHLRVAPGRSKLERVIQEFVIRQKAEPSPPTGLTDTEGLNRSVAHWAFLPAEHRGAFYRRRLLPWVLSRFAGLILQEPEATRARHLQALVTIVSGQKDTTVLVARALTRLGVRHCLLLYSRDEKQEQEQRAAEVRRELLEGFQYEGEQWPAVACEQHAFDPRERRPETAGGRHPGVLRAVLQ